MVGYNAVLKEPAYNDYICPLCGLLMREPYLNSCCGHRFCKSCIDDRVGEEKCPAGNCQKALSNLQEDLDAYKEIQDKTVICKLCNSWEGELKGFVSHEEVQCCTNDGRSMEPSRLKMKDTVQCSHGEQLVFQEMKTNEAEVCQKVPVKCPGNCDTKAIPTDQGTEGENQVHRQDQVDTASHLEILHGNNGEMAEVMRSSLDSTVGVFPEAFEQLRKEMGDLQVQVLNKQAAINRQDQCMKEMRETIDSQSKELQHLRELPDEVEKLKKSVKEMREVIGRQNKELHRLKRCEKEVNKPWLEEQSHTLEEEMTLRATNHASSPLPPQPPPQTLGFQTREDGSDHLNAKEGKETISSDVAAGIEETARPLTTGENLSEQVIGACCPSDIDGYCAIGAAGTDIPNDISASVEEGEPNIPQRVKQLERKLSDLQSFCANTDSQSVCSVSFTTGDDQHGSPTCSTTNGNVQLSYSSVVKSHTPAQGTSVTVNLSSTQRAPIIRQKKRSSRAKPNNDRCFKCHQMGHYKVDCPQANK